MTTLPARFCTDREFPRVELRAISDAEISCNVDRISIYHERAKFQPARRKACVKHAEQMQKKADARKAEILQKVKGVLSDIAANQAVCADGQWMQFDAAARANRGACQKPYTPAGNQWFTDIKVALFAHFGRIG